MKTIQQIGAVFFTGLSREGFERCVVSLSAKEFAQLDKLRDEFFDSDTVELSQYIVLKLLGVYANVCNKAGDLIEIEHEGRWDTLKNILSKRWLCKHQGQHGFDSQLSGLNALDEGELSNGQHCLLELYEKIKGARLENSSVTDIVNMFVHMVVARNLKPEMQQAFCDIPSKTARREKYVFISLHYGWYHLSEHFSYYSAWREYFLQPKQADYFYNEVATMLRYLPAEDCLNALQKIRPQRFLTELASEDLARLLWRLGREQSDLTVMMWLASHVSSRQLYAAISSWCPENLLITMTEGMVMVSESAYVFLTLLNAYSYLLVRFHEAGNDIEDNDFAERLNFMAPFYALLDRLCAFRGPAEGVFYEPDVELLLSRLFKRAPNIIQDGPRFEQMTQRLLDLRDARGSVYLSEGFRCFYGFFKKMQSQETEFALALARYEHSRSAAIDQEWDKLCQQFAESEELDADNLSAQLAVTSQMTRQLKLSSVEQASGLLAACNQKVVSHYVMKVVTDSRIPTFTGIKFSVLYELSKHVEGEALFQLLACLKIDFNKVNQAADQYSNRLLFSLMHLYWSIIYTVELSWVPTSFINDFTHIIERLDTLHMIRTDPYQYGFDETEAFAQNMFRLNSTVGRLEGVQYSDVKQRFFSFVQDHAGALVDSNKHAAERLLEKFAPAVQG